MGDPSCILYFYHWAVKAYLRRLANSSSRNTEGYYGVVNGDSFAQAQNTLQRLAPTYTNLDPARQRFSMKEHAKYTFYNGGNSRVFITFQTHTLKRSSDMWLKRHPVFCSANFNGLFANNAFNLGTHAYSWGYRSYALGDSLLGPNAQTGPSLLHSILSFNSMKELRNWDSWCDLFPRFTDANWGQLQSLPRSAWGVGSFGAAPFPQMAQAVFSASSGNNSINSPDVPLSYNPQTDIFRSNYGNSFVSNGVEYSGQETGLCIPLTAPKTPTGGSTTNVDNWSDFLCYRPRRHHYVRRFFRTRTRRMRLMPGQAASVTHSGRLSCNPFRFGLTCQRSSEDVVPLYDNSAFEHYNLFNDELRGSIPASSEYQQFPWYQMNEGMAYLTNTSPAVAPSGRPEFAEAMYNGVRGVCRPISICIRGQNALVPKEGPLTPVPFNAIGSVASEVLCKREYNVSYGLTYQPSKFRPYTYQRDETGTVADITKYRMQFPVVTATTQAPTNIIVP